MLKKAFRWLFYILVALILLLLAAGAGLYVYVQHNKDQAAREAAAQLGFGLDYKKASLTAWKSWPRVHLRMDSVSLRDTMRARSQNNLLEAGRLELSLNFDRIWDDTLQIESLFLTGGGFHLLADTSGMLNLGALAGERDSTESKGGSSNGLFSPVIAWEGVRIGVRDFAAHYIDSLKGKRFVTHFDSLKTVANTLPTGELELLTDVRTHVDGLAFNTDKGSYLKQTELHAGLRFTRRDTAWIMDSTLVYVGPDVYGMAASFGRGANRGNLRISITNPVVHYDRARRLLHDELEENMKKYEVEGPFPVRAEIYGKPEYDGNVKVKIRYSTQNQRVRINDFQFTDVNTTGEFINRLPAAEGGTGSRRDFRLRIEPTSGYYDGMYIKTPRAIVRGKQNEPFLDAPIALTGGADALARLFGNTNFLFTDGSFKMTTHVNASLMSVADIISTSDGTLLFRDLDVDYRPAGVRFAFASILVNKFKDDVTFSLESGDYPVDLVFSLQGKIDNLLPLLLERPGETIETTVKLTADRLDWVGFRQFFGKESFGNGEPSSGSDAQVQSMKRTLLGLRNSFHPSLEAEIGKMAYYDNFEINNLRTGLHFKGDTMVLDHTTFAWLDSELSLSGRFNMGTFSKTPFRVEAAADNLNLQALREPLTTFGLKLPTGIDSLPTNLRIRFAHRGIINDTFGVQPGHNVGSLEFSDGRTGLFSGKLKYEPVDGILQTTLGMRGDPVFVNDLFAAEKFFFSSGEFKIGLDVAGIPEDLSELIESSALRLEIDGTNLRYEPAGAFVPIKNFSVSANDNHATVKLQLTADETRRSVHLNGEMEGLSAFLYPDRGETFQVRADATAGRLHASDIRTFVSFDHPSQSLPQQPPVKLPSGPTDSVPPYDAQRFVSAGKGIFNSFRPDLSLRIDTFDVDDRTQFRNLHTGLHMEDSTLLVLENSGFETDAGRASISGTYSIDDELNSPFTLKWQTDSILLGEILKAARELDLPGTDSMGLLRGVLMTRGDVRGRMDEINKKLLLEHSRAGIDIDLSLIELSDWPGLEATGKKIWMKKRFREVFLAPLSVRLSVDSGSVFIPRTEIQSSALQVFIEGTYDTLNGPDLLVSVPVFPNIRRGVLDAPPAKTGYAHAGWKVYLVLKRDEDGTTKTIFRLGRRKYYKDRGRLPELRRLRWEERKQRREAREQRRKQRKGYETNNQELKGG